ncbi:MAG: mannose-1-phosphate guanylyltransferase [Calditrichaceae bacterium]|nr:mannose-1-phosphate guanylyltransferase [Calditrichia bacterium]NUQ42021.1 mannose-1-phosphate guanylyltransferase [Calditrichaceae bacterium]
MKIYGILMAGGMGTRFWPRSREKSPKQVLNVFGDGTLIQAAYQRLANFIEDSQILVVTNYDQKEVIQKQLPQLSAENFILEPFGKNTAPCIGLAAIQVAYQDPDNIMIVVPADHVISNVAEFQTVMKLAVDFVSRQDSLVTLGITPDEPATGYGYIQAGEEVLKADHHSVLQVRTFAEKPNLETAKRFLKSGDFYWNSGMFIWRASTILREIGEKLPEIYEGLMELSRSIGKRDYQGKLEDVYRRIKGISIDFGVMQEAQNVYVIPADLGWNDVGSWETVYDISPKDKNLNAGEYAELISIESRKCYVYSPEKAVALVGVENLIIVDTGDALLVCKKSSAQDVKEVVDHLKKKGLEKWL